MVSESLCETITGTAISELLNGISTGAAVSEPPVTYKDFIFTLYLNKKISLR